MKFIIIITALLLTVAAHAQTTRCWKNSDGSITCVRTQGSAGF